MVYNRVFVFGDSLVDSGNVLDLAEWYDDLPFTALPEGTPTAELGYFRGRFSDGYTFADLISNKAAGAVTRPVFPYHFEDPWLGVPVDPFESDPSGVSLNFAYGGSHIRQGDEVVPDLDDQTDAFRDAVDGDAPTNALYLVTTGGNDIRDLAPTGSDPASQAEAYEELQRCADKLLHELSQLVDDGAHHIVITGIPDVGAIPHYDRDGDGMLNATEQMRSDAATDYSIYLDALIRTEVVPALEALGANVTYVPVMDHVDAAGNPVTGALSAILPTLAALHGLTVEDITNDWLAHKDLIFFDHVHPNAQTHALVGSFMQSLISGTQWVETLPLTSAEVDYRLTASIAVPGEVDQLVIAMVAGTSYTFDLLGVSSLGTAGTLADPAMRLLGPSGGIAGADDDSGAGFDATMTFAAAGSGNHTLQMFAVGSVTGSYVLQAAVVGGAAMLAGNSYDVNSEAVLVLEGAGGVGQDVVRASVSYFLRAGSEIEVLRTANDNGKSAINLAGNEFGQTLIGNAGANVLDGNGGADTLIGGGGKDVFVLGAGPAEIIADYAKGEIVDVTQLLSVATGTNLATGGYLRVTKDGLIQADFDGGGNDWVTLAAVNGNSAVTFRYLSGGVATNVTLSRVAGGTGAAVAGAVAASGMADTIAPDLPANEPNGDAGTVASQTGGFPTQLTLDEHSSLLGSEFESVFAAARMAPLEPISERYSGSGDKGLAGIEVMDAHEFQMPGDTAGSIEASSSSSLATTVGIPSAALNNAVGPHPAESGEIGEILADAVAVGNAEVVDALLDALTGNCDLSQWAGAGEQAGFAQLALEVSATSPEFPLAMLALQADGAATV